MNCVRLTVVCCVLMTFLSTIAFAAEDAAPGVVLLYDFADDKGPVVHDRSGYMEPLDLQIGNLNSVKRTAGALEIKSKTVIKSKQKATKLINSIRKSGGEITIEVWVEPADIKQKGPARIVTMSKDANSRNFTLGQDANRYEVRFRTMKSSSNGLPSINTQSNSARTQLTHVVYTRNRQGETKIYINGKPLSDGAIGGAVDNWDENYSFAIGNELTGDRPWLGKFHLVVVYNRALSPKEVIVGFHSGHERDVTKKLIIAERVSKFETKIAPLLSKHCLECHDASNKAGGLDLSRKQFAFKGGDGGKPIVPRDSSESLLWVSVESDEMPHDRPPLTNDEKALLKSWIDSGAEWTLEAIDPAIYVHAGAGDSLWIQRLTVSEYIATVKAALGVDISKEARKALPRDIRADGFSNTAYNLTVDFGHVDAYAKLARQIVQRMDLLKFASRFSGSKRLTDDDARKLIDKLGKWVLRGPLNEDELAIYRGISTTVMATGGSFEDAVGYIVEAMLQSPRFIYRIERQRGDGTRWPINDFELAVRLSYIIWGASPDEQLMNAADKGQLGEKGIAKQVDRMLKDPRAVDRSVDFISQYLDLGRLENMQPNGKMFPNWNAQLADDMRHETVEFFKTVVWEDGRPLTELLNSKFSILTPRLAKHYGLEPKARESGPYDLSDVSSRGGLLTHGSVLTVGGDEASMVSRGLFVMHDMLRGIVKDPPPCVDTTPVPTKPGLTQRAIAEGRIANSNCGGCHGKFEPLAFGLEKYDGIGVYRDADEHGNALRDDGEILFPGTEKPIKYKNAAELMDLLARSDRVKESLTWKVAQFSLGRPLGAEDAGTIAQIHQTSQENGGTYRSLLKAIVLSDLVRMKGTEGD